MDWSATAALASVIIAAAALTFSILSFRAQQQWADKNAQANVRPFFWTKVLTYADHKAVILRNDGVGPAVITSLTFTRSGRSEARVVDLLNVSPPKYWETFTAARSGRVVPPQGEIVLLRQTRDHLLGQGITDTAAALDLLRDIQQDWHGITLEVRFHDIYEHERPPYTREL